MNLKAKIVSTVFMTMCLGGVAQARGGSSSGVLLSANVFMHNSSVEVNPGASEESNNSIYDIKLGYLGGSGLYLGGIYTIKNSETSSTKQSGSAMGASLGYVGSRGFFIKGHYLVSAEFQNLQEGTGYQADVGYMSNISPNVFMGVELSYRTIKYAKEEGNPALTSVTTTDLFPMLSVGLVF